MLGAMAETCRRYEMAGVSEDAAPRGRSGAAGRSECGGRRASAAVLIFESEIRQTIG